eukprot:8762794-Lingulodinium_polyedra.AAC.1
MANCITARAGAGVRRLGVLDGLPAPILCWWHPSQPSLISQCEALDTVYVVQRNLLGDDSTSPCGWESQ